jgi:hypothetical protein
MQAKKTTSNHTLTGVSTMSELSEKPKTTFGTKDDRVTAVWINGRDQNSTRDIRELQPQNLQIERFVNADVAAEFLSVKRKTILDWARAGAIPAHPFGKGKRVIWRFRISEIASHNKSVQGTMNSAVPR